MSICRGATGRGCGWPFPSFPEVSGGGEGAWYSFFLFSSLSHPSLLIELCTRCTNVSNGFSTGFQRARTDLCREPAGSRSSATQGILIPHAFDARRTADKSRRYALTRIDARRTFIRRVNDADVTLPLADLIQDSFPGREKYLLFRATEIGFGIFDAPPLRRGIARVLLRVCLVVREFKGDGGRRLVRIVRVIRFCDTSVREGRGIDEPVIGAWESFF